MNIASPWPTSKNATINPFLEIVIHALNIIGLESRRDGISDIFINDRKISGNAQKRIKGAILHHGTCLLDVYIEKMTKYLRIPPERKGLPHDKFVSSLSNLGHEITFDEFQDLIIKSLEESDNVIKKIDLVSERTNLLDKARDLSSNTYSQNEWIFRRK